MEPEGVDLGPNSNKNFVRRRLFFRHGPEVSRRKQHTETDGALNICLHKHKEHREIESVSRAGQQINLLASSFSCQQCKQFRILHSCLLIDVDHDASTAWL